MTILEQRLLLGVEAEDVLQDWMERARAGAQYQPSFASRELALVLELAVGCLGLVDGGREFGTSVSRDVGFAPQFRTLAPTPSTLESGHPDWTSKPRSLLTRQTPASSPRFSQWEPLRNME